MNNWKQIFQAESLTIEETDGKQDSYLLLEAYEQNSYIRVTVAPSQSESKIDYHVELAWAPYDEKIKDGLAELSTLADTLKDSSEITEYYGHVELTNLEKFARFIARLERLFDHSHSENEPPKELIEELEKMTGLSFDVGRTEKQTPEAFEAIGSQDEKTPESAPSSTTIELPSKLADSKEFRKELQLRFPSANYSFEDGALEISPQQNAESQTLDQKLRRVVEAFSTMLKSGLSPKQVTWRSDTPDSSTISDAEKPSNNSKGDIVFNFEENTRTDSAIPAGQHRHPKLEREDANTALVDVVLRHPGYSRRNMGQVLTILLEIDYNRALEVIEKAPCIIAWNTSRKNALKLKRSIENAGGKILLVEPDYLESDELETHS